MPAAIAIIPARFASTRFPGKALANETGKFLVQHVYERVVEAERIVRCIVATDDARIVDAVQSFGGEAVMTRTDHASGTDRIAEVIGGLDSSAGDLILNVQGDEPEIEPAFLDRLVARMEGEPACPFGTLACPFPADSAVEDPNCVKVIVDEAGHALYFSRSVIPYDRAGDAGGAPSVYLLHLGVYAYRRSYLLQMASWPVGRLERLEKLEQLRILERGEAVTVEVVEHAVSGIDTPQEYARFCERWRKAAGARD